MSHQRTSLTTSSTCDGLSRRNFLASAGAVASWSVLKPNLVHGYAANSKVKIGLIGCGGRGSWIADLFQQHGGYELVAVADYFQDRVDAAGEKLNVAAAQRFTGLAGYERLLEQDLDAVVIESPPYFHPQQAQQAVDAGKHVYLAKPIAVDVPGCQSVAQSGQKATQKGLCFLVDFQTRADEFFVEALQRVHAGAIGQFAFGESTYHAGIPWLGQLQYAREGQANPESRLRPGDSIANCPVTSSRNRISIRSTSRAGSWDSRRLLRTAPAGENCAMWGPVGIRSVSPFSIPTT